MSGGAHDRLAFVIHEINSYMGQERCTLELARRLSRRWPVDIHSFGMEDPGPPEAWGSYRYHHVPSPLRHPQIVRSLWFYGVTTPRLLASRLGGASRPLVHAAGTCSLVSDVVQVHFVHSAWKEKRRHLPEALRLPPRAVSGEGARLRLLRAYFDTLLTWNMMMERFLFTPDKTYVAISRRIADELRRHFGLEDNVHVIHHGVDASEFHPVDDRTLEDRRRLRAELGIAPDELVTLFVGVYERKGLDTVMRALARLEPKLQRRVRLLAVGGGSRERFAGLAAELGIADRVSLEGPRKGIARYYRASDIFLFPTLYEPFGLVVTEAMACGLATIVSREAGASELIEDGVSGFLLDDAADAGEIARTLGRLIEDDALRKEVGEAAQATARARTWDQVAREYEAVLAPFFPADRSQPR